MTGLVRDGRFSALAVEVPRFSAPNRKPSCRRAKQHAKIFDGLGIADQMKAKSHPLPTIDQAIASVASGENELYFALASIIASAKGVELAGLFPAACRITW